MAEALARTVFGTRVSTSALSQDAVLRGGLDAAQAALREELLGEPGPPRPG